MLLPEVKSFGSKGRGVIAKKNYRRGTLVLRNDILPIPKQQRKTVEKNSWLNRYAFLLAGVYFISLGLGSLINHSEKPNLWYSYRKKGKKLEFYAASDIKRGDELTIDYGWDSYPWKKK